MKRREGIRFHRSDPIRWLGTRERNVGQPPVGATHASCCQCHPPICQNRTRIVRPVSGPYAMHMRAMRGSFRLQPAVLSFLIFYYYFNYFIVRILLSIVYM
ncbi:hypothetical protein BS78_02G288900 [Paspalum vaginatum]|nr:hypothetical protein BS78_02G288900 [Paspalum vaginatum]